MNSRPTFLKVMSPVEGKNGKTFWMRIGSAYPNRDGSMNVYLDAYPMSGKLQIRPWDERDRRPDSADLDGGLGGGAALDSDSNGLPF